jgi:hypothetical protein
MRTLGTDHASWCATPQRPSPVDLDDQGNTVKSTSPGPRLRPDSSDRHGPPAIHRCSRSLSARKLEWLASQALQTGVPVRAGTLAPRLDGDGRPLASATGPISRPAESSATRAPRRTAATTMARSPSTAASVSHEWCHRPPDSAVPRSGDRLHHRLNSSADTGGPEEGKGLRPAFVLRRPSCSPERARCVWQRPWHVFRDASSSTSPCRSPVFSAPWCTSCGP